MKLVNITLVQYAAINERVLSGKVRLGKPLPSDAKDLIKTKQIMSFSSNPRNHAEFISAQALRIFLRTVSL